MFQAASGSRHTVPSGRRTTNFQPRTFPGPRCESVRLSVHGRCDNRGVSRYTYIVVENEQWEYLLDQHDSYLPSQTDTSASTKHVNRE